jgi:peroxiredoxin
LEQHHTDFEAAGLQVIAVAHGEPKHAARYCGKFAPSIACLVGAGTAPFETYGIGQVGIKAGLSPNMTVNLLRQYAKGNFGGEITGDVLRMTASFVIDRQGIVRYAYYGKDISDHAPITDILSIGKNIQQSP